MLENLESDFKKQIEVFELRQGREISKMEALERDIAELNETYTSKNDSLY